MDVMIFAKERPFHASENRKPAPATRSLARVGEGDDHRVRQLQRPLEHGCPATDTAINR
jgi:hypothetical protein